MPDEDALITEPFHVCAELDVFNEPIPTFVPAHMINTVTGEQFVAAYLYWITEGGAQCHIQVEFCPFCGKQLSTMIHSETMRKREADWIEQRIKEYHEYRKRFVRSGAAGEPMDRKTFSSVYDEYKETEMLLPHAKPKAARGLMKNKQVLRNKLCLQHIESKPAISAEEFVTLIDNPMQN